MITEYIPKEDEFSFSRPVARSIYHDLYYDLKNHNIAEFSCPEKNIIWYFDGKEIHKKTNLINIVIDSLSKLYDNIDYGVTLQYE